jgi:hypothetical protein
MIMKLFISISFSCVIKCFHKITNLHCFIYVQRSQNWTIIICLVFAPDLFKKSDLFAATYFIVVAPIVVPCSWRYAFWCNSCVQRKELISSLQHGSWDLNAMECCRHLWVTKTVTVKLFFAFYPESAVFIFNNLYTQNYHSLFYFS